MTARRCDRCQFWTKGHKPGNEDHTVYEGIGHCGRPLELWEHKVALPEPEDDDYYGPDLFRLKTETTNGVRMFTQDGSEYIADLYTAPDFHCADFQHKLAEPGNDQPV